MITVTRRHLIRCLAGASAWLPASFVLAAPTGKPDSEAELSALAPYLDTLLPADVMPSATHLQIDLPILDRAKSSGRLRKLLVLGCAWLDAQASNQGAGSFAEVDQNIRDEIVRSAETASPRTLPLVFFQQSRSLAYHLYYARPEVWRGLAYQGPPQPLGFTDYIQPPVAPTP